MGTEVYPFRDMQVVDYGDISCNPFNIPKVSHAGLVDDVGVCNALTWRAAWCVVAVKLKSATIRVRPGLCLGGDRCSQAPSMFCYL